MKRLAIGNAALALALTLIILFSSIHIEGTVPLPAQTAQIKSSTAYYFTITGCPPSVTAGQSFSGLTVTVYNIDGGIYTNYNGWIYFSSTDSDATLPYTSTSTYHFVPGHDHGSHTFSGFNLVTAGLQTITMTDGTVSTSTGKIQVNGASAYQIQIAPKTATLTTGSTQSYTATAKDYFGNSWDVTSSTSWSITSGAGGSWSGNTYTASHVGTWTVTGTYSGLTDQASLTVIHAAASKISISPKTTSAVVGSLVPFTATAFDSAGNSWDVTSSTTWSISSGAVARWVTNNCNATKVGTWTVTGTYGGFSDQALLQTFQGSPASLAISPTNPTVSAGSIVSFNATATDAFGNSWDATSTTTWSIDSGAGASWTANNCTSTKIGIWTVTATYASTSTSTALTVGYASVYKITVLPKSTSLTAGNSVTFDAIASDIYGNSWDVTNATAWNIAPSASGSWLGSTYTSASAETYSVTGIYRGMYDTSTVTVGHGSPTRIVVTASSYTSVAGTSITYTVNSFDGFGNFWDVTGAVAWSIDSGAGASWSSNVCTATKTGTWTVKAVYSGFSDTVPLTVTPASPVSIAVSPNNPTVAAGSSQVFAATATDQYSNTWDVGSLSSWQIDSSANGFWQGSGYTAANSGVWTVTCTYQSFSASTLLNVTHGHAVRVQLSPKTASITSGLSMPYDVTAFDSFNNNWDSTSFSTFIMESGAGGYFNGNDYTAYSAGTWAVTAISLGLSDTGTLTVNHASATQIVLSPNDVSITAGATQPYTGDCV